MANIEEQGLAPQENLVLNEKPKRRLDKQQGKALRLLAGFFASMLLLTVLSRAADSLTVPIVSTVAPASATLDHSVSVEGRVEARREVLLRAEAGYRVQEILCEEGQAVKEGDVLVQLDMQDIQDKLDEAKLTLKSDELTKQANDIALAEVKDTTMDAAILGKEKALKSYAQTREDADKAIEDAREELEKAKAELLEAQQDLVKLKSTTREERIEAAEKALKEATEALDDHYYEKDKALRAAQQTLNAAWKAYNESLTAEPLTDADTGEPVAAAAPDMDAWFAAQQAFSETQTDWERATAKEVAKEQEARDTLNKAMNESIDDQDVIKAAEKAVETAQENIKTKEKAVNAAIEKRDRDVSAAADDIKDADDQIAAAQEKKSVDATNEAADRKKDNIQDELYQLDVSKKEKAVADLEKILASGGVVIAPADGVVSEIKTSVGATTDDVLMTISDDGAGYRIKATIDSESAKYVARGDKATMKPAGESKAIEGLEIESVRTLAGEKTSGQMEITASVPQGAGELGMTATLRIEKDSAKYEICIPLGALHTDSKGDFVLVADEKEGILGKQMVARRVDVRKMDADGNNVAIEGALDRQTKIITESASGKPIVEGDRVRLES